MVSIDSIRSATEEMNMPLYVIEKGVVYEAVCVPESEDRSQVPPRKIPPHLVKGQKVEITELIDNDFNLSEEEKTVKKEALFKNSPFKIKSPEIDMINSRSQGSCFYMANEIVDLANLPEAEEDFTELEKLIQKHREAGWSLAGKESKVVGHIVGVTEDVYSVLIDDKKCLVRQNKLTKKLIFVPIKKDNFYRDTNIIWTGAMNENLGRELKTNEDYIEGTSNLIDELRSKSDNHSQNRLKKLAFHLFGFAEAANSVGDHDMAAQATALAEKIIPREEYQEIISRRFDKKGNFLITEEDLN